MIGVGAVLSSVLYMYIGRQVYIVSLACLTEGVVERGGVLSM